ncbi:translation initiation factor IF-3 [Phosphitispora fastidiosa]|uniref:translation initiation factor IF-3 n=1 Tax=Phosphitispora fastidiosa TaxID=2837202 RepID=UPI001E65B189|nr:translation initiation factor IF-3 [Phosphitispora fastidiosa]
MRINEEIRGKEVRLISSEQEQLGIVPVRDALRMAQEQELDLVEIAPNAKPPVCRIMDFGKYKYEQSKREKEARKKQKIISVKEVKVRPNIEDHDLEVKTKNALKFLTEGDKVKVTLMFRGREMAHAELGKKLLKRVADATEEVATVERQPKVEGRNMIMILAPKQD